MLDAFLNRTPGAPNPQGPMLAAAWDFRNRDGLTNQQQLAAMNVTAWLYTSNKTGRDEIYVIRNITKNEIIAALGPAQTPQAEVGFHAEALAGQFFLTNISKSKVKQIFSERFPCSNKGGSNALGCKQMLQNYFSSIPVYYMYQIYDTTEDGNAPVAKALKDGYNKRQQYAFPKPPQVVPDPKGPHGELQSHYMIYQL